MGATPGRDGVLMVVLAANRSMARLQDEWTKDAISNDASRYAEAMTRVEDANRDPVGRCLGRGGIRAACSSIEEL
jgi:transcription antitermination factor NusA-like protein